MEKERDPGTDVVNSEQVSGLYRKGIFSKTVSINIYNTPYQYYIYSIYIMILHLAYTNVSVGIPRKPVVILFQNFPLGSYDIILFGTEKRLKHHFHIVNNTKNDD